LKSVNDLLIKRDRIQTHIYARPGVDGKDKSTTRVGLEILFETIIQVERKSANDGSKVLIIYTDEPISSRAGHQSEADNIVFYFQDEEELDKLVHGLERRNVEVNADPLSGSSSNPASEGEKEQEEDEEIQVIATDKVKKKVLIQATQSQDDAAESVISSPLSRHTLEDEIEIPSSQPSSKRGFSRLYDDIDEEMQDDDDQEGAKRTHIDVKPRKRCKMEEGPDEKRLKVCLETLNMVCTRNRAVGLVAETCLANHVSSFLLFR
jgi:hypothetical protein